MALHPCRYAQIVRTLACLVAFTFSHFVQATMIVNPARSITRRVDVQIIQTELSDSSQKATLFGDPSQRASIEASIDMVWAQAGIDIRFLPITTIYADNFAFQGTSLPTVVRPQTDLDSIISNARTAGVTNSNSLVLNMFFVEIAPGFSQLGSWSVSGIAKIGLNGSAVYVGHSLLGLQVNRDIVAGIVAHEIGHNLGLGHTTAGIANLMSSGGTSDQLTQQQIDAIFQINTFFLQPATPAGDFTGDGYVNGADLTIWQNAFGTSANGDADGDSDSDGRDFLTWQREYGIRSGITATSLGVPEPSTSVLILALAIVVPQRGTQRISSTWFQKSFPRRQYFALTARLVAS